MEKRIFTETRRKASFFVVGNPLVPRVLRGRSTLLQAFER